MSNFYMLTTPISVLLTVVATAYTIMYPELFDKKENQPMEINMDDSNNIIMAFTVLTIFAVLFLPVINFIFSILYSGQILFEICRLRRNRDI
jgi:uncharacterized membrane protein